MYSSSTQTVCLWGLVGLAYYAATSLGPPGTFLPPASWPVVSICVWLAYSVLKTGEQDRRGVVWGVLSACALASFLAQDQSFNSWGDVYFFCGPQMQYCTCGFRWNFAGWYKAFVLWNFVLSAALGVQRVIIQLGLCGLLPGEEVVTRESFISICWRLIPYWLNNWEQQWGAECSSMMFELPHFAVELVIILPCVQILCSRMKVLAMPSVNAALPPGRDGRPEVVREEYVPNVLRGCWERQPEQRQLWHRIRANKRIIAFSCTLCLMALLNALYIPLHLEELILKHPDAAIMQVAGRMPDSPPWHDVTSLEQLRHGLHNGSIRMSNSFVYDKIAAAALRRNSSSTAADRARVAAAASMHYQTVEAGPWHSSRDWVQDAVSGLVERVRVYVEEPRQCPDGERLKRNLLKHHEEIFRMQDPEHHATIPLVEIALALMRLSTEKFFVLMSLYVAFLVFRVPPRFAALLISLNARVSSAFARLILYSFPAVCWVYGAGFIFSTFVSVVFWGGPIMQMYEFLRSNICSVSIKALRPATAAEIERMHGDCAICWCEMSVAPGADSSRGRSRSSASEATDAAAGSSAPASAQAAAELAEDATATAATPAGEQEAVAPGQQVIGNEVNVAAAAPAPAPGVELLQVAGSPGVVHGYTLPCGHAYHHPCLNQWLQQCHSQNVTPTCPMCQAPLQLHVQWHLLWRWGRPAAAAAGAAAGMNGLGGAGGMEAVGDAANNYLLEHQPRLADLLADMPQILAQENVQLLAEVQDLRHQRQQLMGELQLRQQQLQELAGRQQQMELEGMEMEQQRQQLLQELQLLRRARNRQRQLQQLIEQQEQRRHQQHSLQEAAGLDELHAAPWASSNGGLRAARVNQTAAEALNEAATFDLHHENLAAVGIGVGEGVNPMNLERFRQLEMRLDAFISEQMHAARRAAAGAAAGAAAEPEAGQRGTSTWREALRQRKRLRQQQLQPSAPQAAAAVGDASTSALQVPVGVNSGDVGPGSIAGVSSRPGHVRSASLNM